MEINWMAVAVGAALVGFNIPILLAGLQALRTKGLNDQIGKLLKEKDASGDPTTATSYSRVAGAIGAIMMASLFWVVSNIAIVVAILSPHNLTDILSNVGKLFLVGAALFLPYVFNQLKSVLQ